MKKSLNASADFAALENRLAAELVELPRRADGAIIATDTLRFPPDRTFFAEGGIKGDFATVIQYSPLHNNIKGRTYPPLFIGRTTRIADDRKRVKPSRQPS